MNPSPITVTAPGQVFFDHERLEVYQQAVAFLVVADEVASKLPTGRAYLADQLHRAALSVVLNIGEGAGEFSKKEKARFYRMALRSGTECAAVLDGCRVLRLANIEEIVLGRQRLLSVVRMLSKMVLNLRPTRSKKPKL